MKDLRIDERFEAACPPLTKDEFTKLESLILKDGVIINPILLWDGVIIDGHNRYQISKKHNIPFTTNEIKFNSDEEAIIWIKENAISQRNLNAYQRSCIVLELEDIYKQRAKENQGTRVDIKQKSAEVIETRNELAKLAGVSHDTIDKVKKIEVLADEFTKQSLTNGGISINKAFKDIHLPKTEINPAVDILESAAKSLDRWININADKEPMFEFIPSISVLVKKIRDKKTTYIKVM